MTRYSCVSFEDLIEAYQELCDDAEAFGERGKVIRILGLFFRRINKHAFWLDEEQLEKAKQNIGEEVAREEKKLEGAKE